MIERFPEDIYPMDARFISECIQGYELMKTKTFFLYGLARNCAKQVKYNRLRLIKLRQMFSYGEMYCVTNGNTDETLQEIHMPLQGITCDPRPQHGSVISQERFTDMAYYRNLGLKKQRWPDYTIVLDFDTHGFSYDGIANSIYHMERDKTIDFIGSNGLIYQDGVRLYYDALAYRRLGATKPHDITEINLLRYERNDPLVHVQSCFGGLGIYRSSKLIGMEYQDDDCDHVTINRHLNCYLNPGMIVLYSKNPYEI